MKHDIRITDTGEQGWDSGRPRYRVACTVCQVVVHRGTTAPDIRVKEHLEGGSPYETPCNGGTGPGD